MVLGRRARLQSITSLQQNYKQSAARLPIAGLKTANSLLQDHEHTISMSPLLVTEEPQTPASSLPRRTIPAAPSLPWMTLSCLVHAPEDRLLPCLCHGEPYPLPMPVPATEDPPSPVPAT